MRRVVICFIAFLGACTLWPDHEEEPAPAEPEVLPRYFHNPPSEFGHELDGRFTGSGFTSGLEEWRDIIPADGEYGDVYLDYDGEVLNVGILGHDGGYGSVPSSCPLSVRVMTGDGTQRAFLLIRPVVADSVIIDDQVATLGVASAQDRSALHPNRSLWMHEFVLPVDPGRFGFFIEGAIGDACGTAMVEPTPIGGVLHEDGGVTVDLSDRPLLVDSTPRDAKPGQLITLYGLGLDGVHRLSVGRRDLTIDHNPARGRLGFVVPDLPDPTSGFEVIARRPDVSGPPLRLAAREPVETQGGGGGTYVPPPMNPITVDGEFTGWDGGASHEWNGIPPLTGRYTHLYAAYRNDTLYFLNDWHYNTKSIPAEDCYNEFTFNVGWGTDARVYTIRAHNNGEVSVLVDGVAVEETDLEVQGGHSWGTSPLMPDEPHTIWELGVSAPPGGSDCQLHDPGPSPQSSCSDLATEENVFRATLLPGGGFIGGLTTDPVALEVPALQANRPATVRVANLDEGSVVQIGGEIVPVEAAAGQDRWSFEVPGLDEGTWTIAFRDSDGRWSVDRQVFVEGSEPFGVWTEVAVSAPPRAGHAAITDTVGGRVLMFGGESSDGVRGDTFVFEGGAMSTLAAPWHARNQAGMATSIGGGTVVFGGDSAVGGPRAEMASWNGQAWLDWVVPGEGIPPRAEFGMVTSPVGLLLFGGRGNPQGILGDVWRFDGVGWTLLADNEGPGALAGASMIWSDSRYAALVFGGRNGASQATNELWSLSWGGSWTQVVGPTAPSPRWGAAFAEVDGVPVLFGGFDAGGQPLGDAWYLGEEDVWYELEMAGVPSPRGNAPLVLDPASGALFLHGGEGAGGALLSDAWVLEIED